MTRLRIPEKALLYSIWIGFVLILLMPFVVTFQTIFPYIVGKALYSRVIIEIVFGLWTLLAFLRPAYRPPRSWILILFAIILGVSTLSAYFGVSVQRSFWSTYERMQGVVDLAHWFVFAVVLVSVIQTAQGWRVLLNLNLGVSLTVALLAIGQVYYFPDAPFLIWDAPTARVGATLGNPLYLGTALMVNIVIALGFLVQSFIPVAAPGPSPSSGVRRRKRKRRSSQAVKIHSRRLWVKRLFWGSVALLELWAFSLAGSRGALVGLVTAVGCLAVVSLFLGHTRITRFITVGLTSLFGVAVVLMLIVFFRPSIFTPDTSFSNPLLRYLINTSDMKTSSSIQTRLAAWEAGFKGFVNKPVLGWGPENYVVIFGRHASGFGSHMRIHDNAHSKLVEELATKGLLGLLSYLSIWVFMFFVVVRVTKRMDSGEQILILSVGAALMAYFVQSQFVPDAPTSSLQYILLLAFVANLERAREETTPTHGRWARLRQLVALVFERLSRTNLLQHNGARTVIAVGVVALVGMSLLANYAIYSAASAAIRTADWANTLGQFRGAVHRANTLGQFRGAVQQAISDFKPLANYPRLILFTTMAELWEGLRAQSGLEAERMLALVNAEAVAALESEPENWRIYVRLAKLYRVVSASDPEYEAMAKRYLEKALELAPRRKESLELAPS